MMSRPEKKRTYFSTVPTIKVINSGHKKMRSKFNKVIT